MNKTVSGGTGPAATVGDMAAIDLIGGDFVTAQGDHLKYVVAGVDAQHGHVQIADTTGETHTYQRMDKLSVTRPA
jgi:hypothetical protein